MRIFKILGYIFKQLQKVNEQQEPKNTLTEADE